MSTARSFTRTCPATDCQVILSTNEFACLSHWYGQPEVFRRALTIARVKADHNPTPGRLHAVAILKQELYARLAK